MVDVEKQTPDGSGALVHLYHAIITYRMDPDSGLALHISGTGHQICTWHRTRVD